MGDLDQPRRGRDPGAGGILFDRPRIGCMQDSALGGQQTVVCSLLHERMSESVAFDGRVLIDEQELGGDRAAQRQAQLDVRQPADLGKEVVFDLPAGDGGDLDQPAGGLRAGREADLEDAAQGLGQALTAAARLIGGRREFLGEECVSVGTPLDGVDERRGPGARRRCRSAVRRVRRGRTAPR